MKQHKLVILGSMDEFVELVKQARARGIYTIVCDGYPDGPAKPYADKQYDIDIRNVDGVAEMCKKEEADGIVTSFSDIMFEHLVKIADRAGLPCYLTPDKLHFLREKPEMKKMFDAIGVHSPKSVRLKKDFSDEELAGLRFPLVIKPINGYGSRGIYVVNTPAEIRQLFDAVRKYSTEKDILAEEYNDGHEFNMMNWVVDGTVYVLSIADREKVRPRPGEFPHLVRVTYPSRLIHEVYDEARDVVQKVADYVGIKEGPLSMQFFWDKERGVEVCEITGRLFGYEHELVTYSGGFSVEKLLLDYVYDKKSMAETMKNHSPFFQQIASGLYFHGKEGTVRDQSAVRELCARPSVKESIIFYNEGDTVSHEVGAKPYFVRMYLLADSYEELDRESAVIFEKMVSPDENGENLILKNEVPEY